MMKWNNELIVISCKAKGGTYPIESFVYELLRNPVVFNISEANIFESIVDFFRDLSSSLRRPSSSRFEINNRNTESINDRCNHFALCNGINGNIQLGSDVVVDIGSFMWRHGFAQSPHLQ